MSEFTDVWSRILHILEEKKLKNEPVETLCKRVKNHILEVNEDYIVLQSEKSRGNIPRKILKRDFELVYNKLIQKPIFTLNDIREVVGRRSIICSVLALHESIVGRCEKGKVLLKLKDKLRPK